ncbi:MAG: 1-(5-phosphoribosyl)-5-[(5-phosphoribosylamino)methylideneamino]imidazole-4-carboxamide isomerase [Chloroflexi bacterium]|nr:1-(5-phosphoribosyl)-5-[(5-phosphoribosylamino)methylideneamino]imidazole-4-carboxamide isomerase [Chloroflexota bacterium]
MEVIPAIDLKGGKCVRLYQGDYRQETVFSDDPVGMARHWSSLGALRLHLVDLDGAAKGEPCHTPVISEIAKAIHIPVQVGGGIRRMETIEILAGGGVDRVILGTAAAEEPELVREACHRFGEAIVVGVDARDGYVATHGWKKKTRFTAVELIQEMTLLGAKRFIYTDISRDGTLSQPNFEAIAELLSMTKLPIIASGGIASISHLVRLKQLGAEGAIVGRALYSGDIRLEEALAVLR